MILLVDNSKDLSTAQMTPKLIDYLLRRNVRVAVASSIGEVRRCLALYRLRGAILSGGPLLLTERTQVDHYSQNIMALLHMERRALPVLGICFGMQVMAAAYGGKVDAMKHKKEGVERVMRVGAHSHLMPPRHTMRRMVASHQDRVVRVPPGFEATSVSACGTIIQSMEDTRHRRYGVQFHPEGSKDGHRLLDRFIGLCYT